MRLREVTEEIINTVRENRDKLKSCSFHEFTTRRGDDTKFPSRQEWICKNCGGKVNGTEKYWYEKGVEHAYLKDR